MIRLSFVCGAGISSRLIAWYGNGYGGYSHVDAQLPDGTLLGARSDNVGDQPPGVQIRPNNYEKWIRRAIVTINCAPAKAFNWQQWLTSQIGRPYDKQAILGFILGLPKHDEGHWICSACQTGALIAAGLIHKSPVPDSQITPDSLFILATAGLGGSVEYVT